MEIKILLTDYDNNVQWQRTAQNFEMAEMNLGSLERAYKRELEKIKQDKEYEEEDAVEDTNFMEKMEKK